MEENVSRGPGGAGCPNLGLSGECGKDADGECHLGKTDKNTSRTSIQQCRESMGDQGVGLTDAEIVQMRDYAYQLLDIIAEELEQELRKGGRGTCGAA